MAKWIELGPFTIFDVETTGMSPTNDRIVEIAAIKVERDGTRTQFHSLVNPCRPIPTRATNVHRITNEMVRDQPSFQQVGGDFMNFVGSSTLVAHNGRFDLGFLQESLHREGLPLWDGKTMDSIPLIKRAFPDLPSYSLGYLRERFALGQGDEQAHRAFNDVEWTLEILGLALDALLRQQ